MTAKQLICELFDLPKDVEKNNNHMKYNNISIVAISKNIFTKRKQFLRTSDVLLKEAFCTMGECLFPKTTFAFTLI